MPRVVYDTNVFITLNPQKFPSGFLMSAVVIQELAAGARDKSRLQKLYAVWRHYEKESRLLAPTAEDWWLAGKVLNSLACIVKPKDSRIVAISKEEQQRILRDVLIARTARRAGATVVTFNLADFLKINSYCKVRLTHPDIFFA